jgi:hypothetical protein
MGDRRSEKTILIREMWWEGSDFHTIDIEGNHAVYKNAQVTGHDYGHDDGTMTAEEVVYVAKEQ